MIWLLLITAVAGPEGNLLLNPGFENATGGVADHWNVFVMEHPALPGGAQPPQGAIVTTASEGKHAALLHNTAPYPKEPCNNFSQIIWEKLAGKKIKVAGAIKTQDATAAAIWAQCWQRTPYKLLRIASTGDRTSVSGTTGWTHVEMSVDVPENTDFVIIRCVLRGKGKAWFDDLSVTDITPPAPEPSPKPEPHPEPKTNAKELQSVLKSLRAASKANKDLLAQVESLQQEIQALRGQLEAMQKAAVKPPEAEPPAPPAPALSPPKKVPPLVPHGMKPEEYL